MSPHEGRLSWDHDPLPTNCGVTNFDIFSLINILSASAAQVTIEIIGLSMTFHSSDKESYFRLTNFFRSSFISG
jgi:hypothetical protein